MGKKKKEEISTEKARQVLVKENQDKIENCRKEIQAVLDRNGCILDASILVTARGNVPQINIAVRQAGA